VNTPAAHAVPPLRWTDGVIATLLAVFVFALAWPRVVPEVVGIHNDDGVYVITAKALATGQGYRLLHVRGEPLQTKYPPLYPLLLAAIWCIDPSFPDNVVALKAAGLAAAAAAAGLFYLLLVRYSYAGRTAAAIGLATGFSAPRLIYVLSLTMSETLFLALLASALIAAEHAYASPERPRPAFSVWAGFLLASVVLTRSIGLFAAAGVTIALLWQRRATTAYLLAAWTPVAAWFVWCFVAGGRSASLQSAYTTSYTAWWARVGPDAVVPVVRTNIAALLFDFPTASAQGLREWWLPDDEYVPLFLLAGTVLLAVGIAGARPWRRPTPLALAAYFVAVIVWPWPPVRFLLPMLPLVWAFCVAALFRAPGTKSARRAVAVTAGALCLLVIGSNVGLSAMRAREARESGVPMPRRQDVPAQWRDFQDLFAAVRTHTPPGAVVATVVDPMVYLYADRFGTFAYELNSIGLYYSSQRWITADRMQEYARAEGASYVLRLPIPAWNYDEIERGLDSWRQARQQLESVYRGRDDRFELLHISADSTLGAVADGPSPQAPLRDEVREGSRRR
jgi:hypothetical protein